MSDGGISKRELLKRMAVAQTRLHDEMTGYGDSKYARGLSNEGYAGGYLQALHDVEALLQHGYPNDPRGYWRKDKP